MANFLTYGQCFDYTREYRKTWRDDHKGDGPKTNKINASHLIQYKSKGLKVKQIDQGLIDEMKVEYCFAVHDHTDTTIRKIIKAIQTVLNHCIDAGRLIRQDKELPWVNSKGKFSFKAPDNNKVDRHIISPAECAHFAECARTLGKNELADTILLMCYTGMGWEEWSQLQVQDIEIGVPLPNIKIGKRKDFTVKTPARRRILPLEPGTPSSELLLPILHRQIELCDRQPTMTLFGDYWDNDDLYRAEFKRVRDFAQISDKFTPYCCRHTFITWLAQLDVHISKLMKLAGHSQMETTLKYYTHVADDVLASAMGRLQVA